MARTRPEPWKSFADWLTAQRGLNPASVSTYLTQVRRMLHDVAPLTPDDLTAWVDGLPTHHRSPHRTAWRCYVAWSASRGETVPDLVVSEPAVEVPPEVVDAIGAILAGAHLKPRDIAGMTWQSRVASAAKERAFPDKVFFHAPEDVRADYALLDRDALTTVTRWAYGDDEPGSGPLLPRSPGEPAAMSPTTIQRLLRERRRTAAA
jgi:hypothetical protein